MQRTATTVEAEPRPRVIVEAQRVVNAYPHKLRKKAEKTGCKQCHIETDDAWDWFWGLNRHRSDLDNFDHELITAPAMNEEETTKSKVQYFKDEDESLSETHTKLDNLDDLPGAELQPA